MPMGRSWFSEQDLGMNSAGVPMYRPELTERCVGFAPVDGADINRRGDRPPGALSG